MFAVLFWPERDRGMIKGQVKAKAKSNDFLDGVSKCSKCNMFKKVTFNGTDRDEKLN